MGPLTLAIFTLVALIAGGAFVWGTPLLGIPLLLVALTIGAFGMFAARAKRAGDIHTKREDAKTQKTEFTERDRRTLA